MKKLCENDKRHCDMFFLRCYQDIKNFYQLKKLMFMFKFYVTFCKCILENRMHEVSMLLSKHEQLACLFNLSLAFLV